MRRAWLALGIIFLMLAGGCASSGGKSQSKYRYYKQRHTTAYSTHGRIGKIPHSDVPLTINDRVLSWVDYFTGPNRERFERYLQRSGRYMTLFRQVLKRYGLPEDLVYVALIESGFSNRATSVASAAGTWQFIQSTGRHYGLGINTWLDERRDPEKAVDAAARYLRNLYNEFGDWYLAMAAYNAGEGRIRNAIARYGTKNFWDISAPGTNALRAETRDYVPKFIAAAIVAKSPEQFGFTGVKYQAPWSYERARIDSQTDLQIVAECAGVSLDDILDLNPDLRAGMTPPGVHEVRLPLGTAKRFQVAFARVPRDERVRVAYYTVERRDTLPRIARNYGVSVRELMAANNLRRAKDIYRGQQLVIPRMRGRPVRTVQQVEVASVSRPQLRSETEASPVASSDTTAATTYTVRRGDSLSDIATQFGVTVDQLREWNDLQGRSKKLYKGQHLQVSAAIAQEPVVVQESGVSSDTLALAQNETSAEPTEVTTTVQPEAVVVEPLALRKVKPAAKPSVRAHVVRRGDSLAAIAQKYGTTVADLRRINGLGTKSAIRPGQKLILGRALSLSKGGVAAISTSDKLSMSNSVQKGNQQKQVISKGKKVIHKVRAGDTVWDLSRLYKVSPEQIKVWNNIPHGKLKPGQSLTIHLQSSRS